MSVCELVPDLLTIEEAARVLRIGRTAAYEQARVWRETGGRAGIPSIAVGGQYRVPRAELEAMIGHPITSIPAAQPRGRRDVRRPASQDALGAVRQLDDRRTTRRRRPPSASGQSALPV